MENETNEQYHRIISKTCYQLTSCCYFSSLYRESLFVGGRIEQLLQLLTPGNTTMEDHHHRATFSTSAETMCASPQTPINKENCHDPNHYQRRRNRLILNRPIPWNAIHEIDADELALNLSVFTGQTIEGRATDDDKQFFITSGAFGEVNRACREFTEAMTAIYREVGPQVVNSRG